MKAAATRAMNFILMFLLLLGFVYKVMGTLMLDVNNEFERCWPFICALLTAESFSRGLNEKSTTRKD